MFFQQNFRSYATNAYADIFGNTFKALNNWRILHLKASSLKSYSFWRFFYLVTFETEEMHAIEITRQKFQVKQEVFAGR